LAKNKHIEIGLSAPQMSIYQDTSRFRAVCAGRRFGKTQEIKAELITVVGEPNQIAIYLAPTRPMVKKLMFKPLSEWLATYDYGLSNIDKTELTFEFKNGSVLYCGGAYNYDSYRGIGANFTALDEAAMMPEEVWGEVIRPTLSDTKGRALIVSTAKGRSNWFYPLFTNPYFSTHQFTTLQGGWVEEEEIEAAKNMLDEKTFRQEYEASFESTGNVVYYTFSDKNITDCKFNPFANTYLCFDFNVGEKPMSCIVVQETTKINVVKEFIYKYSNTEGMCESVKTWLDQQGFEGTLNVTGDNTGNFNKSAASRSDYQIIDFFFKNYKDYNKKTKATKSIRNRVACLNSLFLSASGISKLYIDKSCDKLIEDLRRVEWRENGTQLDDKDAERTHASDALSYFAYNYYPIDGVNKTLII
jgi:hypothetical protein